MIPATEDIVLSPPWSPVLAGFLVSTSNGEIRKPYAGIQGKLFQLINDICTWVIPHGLLFKCTVRALPVDTTLSDTGQAAARGKADIPVSQMRRLVFKSYASALDLGRSLTWQVTSGQGGVI